MIKGSFFEFNVARSAIFTAQANMQVTGHNIANAATDGYSRQYGVTLVNNPMRSNGSGMYGTGSHVETVARHRSAFLDQKYWSQNAVHSRYETSKPHLQSLERTFTTVGIDGTSNLLLDQMSELQSIFSDLSTNANDLTFRNNTINAAKSLSEVVAQIGNSLTQQQQQINQEIVISVNQMNNIANQITRLNKQIQQAEFSGDSANDLRDQRERLVDELSGYANVEVKELQKNKDYDPFDPYTTPPNYEFVLLIDGNQYIKGTDVNELQLVNRDDNVDAAGNPDPIKKNPGDGPGLYDIYFSGSKVKFPMYSSSLQGSLKSLIDIRDGNNARGLTLEQHTDSHGRPYGLSEFGEEFYRTTDFKGIPHYIDRVNELARTFARAVNEGLDHNGKPLDGVVGHVNGYDLDGNTGRFFFTMYDYQGNALTNVNDEVFDKDGTSLGLYKDLTDAQKSALYENMDWNQFTVSTELVNDPSLIATSSKYGVGESDNLVALGFSSLMDNPNLYASGKMNDFLIGITSEIAVNSKQSSTFEVNYASVVTVAENQRLQVSGVSLNEESANMIKYQQMYQAAAKMINVIDSIYDITINQLIR